MGSHSSDSDDSSTRGRKTRRRSRSTGRSSSHRSKHSSSRHKERSPSSRYRSRRSRSYSRDRSRYTRHRRSRSRDAYRKRSRSREDRRDRKKDKRSRHKKRSTSRNRSSRRSTSSSSSSSESSPGRSSVSGKGSSEKALRDKLLDTIKAASAVDARAKEANVSINVKSCNDFDLLPPIKPDPDAIRDIEEEHFAPKAFKSSKRKEELPDVKLLAVERKIPEKTVFHSSFFEDSQEKMDRWVKKLFQIRQRALNGGSPQ